MGYNMQKATCPACKGELYHDTEFGMIQCIDCKWHTVNDDVIHELFMEDDADEC